jgi:hypothetical protein
VARKPASATALTARADAHYGPRQPYCPETVASTGPPHQATVNQISNLRQLSNRSASASAIGGDAV